MATKLVKKKTVAKKPVKKAVAKKAPAKKKVVAKKAVAKKAPAKKKAVAKKPVKKAVVKKTAKKAPVKKGAVSGTISYAPANEWLNKETALPDFLLNQNLEVKKTPVATQQYVKNKKQSPKSMFAALALLLFVIGSSAYLLSSSNGNDSNSDKVSVTAGGSVEQADSDASDNEVKSDESQIDSSPSPKPSKGSEIGKDSSGVTSPTPKASKDPGSQIQVQSPRTFLSSQTEQMATLKWLVPKNMNRVIAFELFAKTSGQSDWVLISTVTTEQLEVEVELTPTDSSTQFRVASLLDNDKKIFNETIITLPGSLT